MKDSGFSSWPTARSQMANGTGDKQQGGDDLQTATQNWMTPVANDDNKSPEAHMAMKARMKGGPRNTVTSLQVQAKMWGTPRGSDGEKGGPNMSFGAGGTPLPSQAANWPTATVRDHKGSSPTSLTRKDGKSRLDMLDFAAEQGFTRPDHLTWPRGALSLPAIQNSRRLFRLATSRLSPATLRRLSKRETWTTRRLNPVFVSSLMGFPTGHAFSGFWEMRSTPSPQPMRGETSLRLTASEPSTLEGKDDREDMRAVRKDLHAAKDETRQEENLLSEMSFREDVENPAREGFMKWQQDMRGALCHLPTASAAWIWEPMKDNTHQDQLTLL